jgi:hypothetical protein
MSALRHRINSESGQAFVFVAFTLMVLVGMAALVVDGGSWYRADRHLQTATDAAALAGAQELPDWSSAESEAVKYGTVENGVGLDALSINPTPGIDPNTIHVSAEATAPGIFARVISATFNEVTISAEAEAQVFAPFSMKNVAPIAVQDTSACVMSDPDCFYERVILTFNESNIASSLMGLINVKCNSDSPSECGPGRTGGDEERNMIECDPLKPDNRCNSEALPSGRWYGVKTGGTAGPVRQGLEYAASKGTRLIFPVFDEACPGALSCAAGDKSFHIIGWAAFVIDAGGVNWPGGADKERTLTGHFEPLVATDLAAGGTLPDPDYDFGVHVIVLTQ